MVCVGLKSSIISRYNKPSKNILLLILLFDIFGQKKKHKKADESSFVLEHITTWNNNNNKVKSLFGVLAMQKELQQGSLNYTDPNNKQ